VGAGRSRVGEAVTMRARYSIVPAEMRFDQLIGEVEVLLRARYARRPCRPSETRRRASVQTARTPSCQVSFLPSWRVRAA
jgi:hypothetical protein